MDKYEEMKELEAAIKLGIHCIQNSRFRENNSDNPDVNLIKRFDNAIRTLQTFVETTK